MNSKESLPLTPVSNRIVARVSALGALLVIVAIIGGVWALYQTELELEKKRVELQRLQIQISGLQLQLAHFKKINQEFNEAVSLQSNKEYKESANKLELIVKCYPNDEVAYYWLARANAMLGRYQQATNYAIESITLAPDYIDPYHILVYALHYSGNDPQALDCLRKALNLNIDAYSYFWGRTKDMDEIWKIKSFRDIFLAQDETNRKIQRLLKKRGYYTNSVDGIVGSKTRLALINFCWSQHITNSIPVDVLVQKLQSTNGQK